MSREKQKNFSIEEDSEETPDFIDEHEYEISSTSNRKINWRRIELVKEQQWLKKQLEDYDDWE